MTVADPGKDKVRRIEFLTEEQQPVIEPPLLQPLTKDEQIAALEQENTALKATLAELMPRLSDRRWLTRRVIALLNSERRLMYVAIGAAGALMLVGGGLGIKAVYDAAHRPPDPPERVITRSVPIYIPGESLPNPSPSASPSPTGRLAVGAQPRPSPSTLVSLPLPSPSLPVRVKHCPPPAPDVPPRCLPRPSPLPSPLPPLAWPLLSQ